MQSRDPRPRYPQINYRGHRPRIMGRQGQIVGISKLVITKDQRK